MELEQLGLFLIYPLLYVSFDFYVKYVRKYNKDKYQIGLKDYSYIISTIHSDIVTSVVIWLAIIEESYISQFTSVDYKTISQEEITEKYMNMEMFLSSQNL